MNRCIYLLCHHTDGQKMFSCHGSKMYSITEEEKIEKKDCLASCYTTAAAAESEFYCPETSIRNPPDHVSHHQQRLHPVTSLRFAYRAARPGKHQRFHV